jgi:hypothetical protein
MTLQELVKANYENHPSFSGFGIDNLELNTDLVNEFNSEYGDPKVHSNTEALEKKLTNLLSLNSQIFESLAFQVNDDVHKLFFSYLGEAISKFLEEEFEFRKKVVSRRSPVTDPQLNEKVHKLEAESHFMGKLSENATNHILKLSESALKDFRVNVSLGKVSRNDLSINQGDLVRKIGWIIDKEFRRNSVFEAVSDFFGIAYDHTGLSLELSTEKSVWWKNKINDSLPPRTMYAHLDEAFFAPKSIVYLSDVLASSGPTSCYPKLYKELNNNPLKDIVGRVVGTVSGRSELVNFYKSEYHQAFSSPQFRNHFMSIPELIRFNSHFGWDVLPNSDLEKFMVQKENVMLGVPGDFVVFDGAQLLHRGGLITQGERVVLQVVFYPKSKIDLSTRLKWQIQKFVEKI